MRKTIYLLNIGDYAPELTALTYPHIYNYADKIGADICKITERRFPDWDLDYEKLQIYELGEERGDDWSIYIDSDALVHPELPDVTALIPRDTVAHNGADFAGIRWRYDKYFYRDGRNIGSCNWFATASSWCRDLWRPLDDMTFPDALANIRTTVQERNPELAAREALLQGRLNRQNPKWEDDAQYIVVPPEHLVSDYALSRNIARFGLKFTTLLDLQKQLGLNDANFFHHEYTVDLETKTKHIRQRIKDWGL